LRGLTEAETLLALVISAWTFRRSYGHGGGNGFPSLQPGIASRGRGAIALPVAHSRLDRACPCIDTPILGTRPAIPDTAPPQHRRPTSTPSTTPSIRPQRKQVRCAPPWTGLRLTDKRRKIEQNTLTIRAGLIWITQTRTPRLLGCMPQTQGAAPPLPEALYTPMPSKSLGRLKGCRT